MTKNTARPPDHVLLTTVAVVVPAPMTWLPRAALAFDWRPSVLVIGRELSRHDRARIEQVGVVEFVPTIAHSLIRLGEARWDAVVVAPAITDDADGVRFVHAFKSHATAIGGSSTLADLQAQYARVPFLLQPLKGDTQFALFVSAAKWFLGTTDEVPFGEAILQAIRAR